MRRIGQWMLFLAVLCNLVALIVAASNPVGAWLLPASVVILCLDLFVVAFWRARRRKPRYPLVPPEGMPDTYFPRTNIPRPVVEDFREMEEKKRKFKKLQRIIRRSVSRKKT